MFITNTNIIVAIPVEVRVADAAVVVSTVVDIGSTVEVSDPGLKSIL